MFLRITHKIILTGSINLLGIWDILIAQISLLLSRLSSDEDDIEDYKGSNN